MAGELTLFDFGDEPVIDVSVKDSFTLRPYQIESLDALFESWDEDDSILMVKATGLGKTVTFAEVIARWPNESGRVLVMVHREELMEQACDKLETHLGVRPQVEMGPRHAAKHGLMAQSNVVVTSVQTMSRPKRMKQFDPEEFGLCIIDEAHHATAPTYRRVIEYFRKGGLKLLGVTATPRRKDKKGLGQVFDACCYNMGIAEGIEDGWLVDLEQKYVVVDNLDFSWIKTTAGDLNEKQLAEAMGAGAIEFDTGQPIDDEQAALLAKQESMLHAVVKPTLDEADGRPVLVFAVTKEHARRLTEVFNRYQPGCAEYVIAETPKDERKWSVHQFQNGRLQVLVGVGVFTEGFDAPAAAVIAVARPTKSEALYTQMIGRGTRPLPGTVDGIDTDTERRRSIAESEKPKVTVLDFVGNSGRHRLISAVNVLAGEEDERDIEAAAENMREDGSSKSVMDAIREAKKAREVAEERERQRQEEEAARRAKLRADAAYRTRDVDPFGYQGVSERDVETFRGGSTDKQIGYLVRLGVSREGAMKYTRRQAGAVIDKLTKQVGRDYIMRFGKFAGQRMRDIPTPYLRWMEKNLNDKGAANRAIQELNER